MPRAHYVDKEMYVQFIKGQLEMTVLERGKMERTAMAMDLGRTGVAVGVFVPLCPSNAS